MVLEGCHLIHIHAIEKVALGHECYQMLFLTIVAGAVPWRMEVSKHCSSCEREQMCIDKGVNDLVVLVLVPLQKQVSGTDWPTYLSW